MKIHRKLSKKLCILFVLLLVVTCMPSVNAEVTGAYWTHDIYLKYDTNSPYYDINVRDAFDEAAKEWNDILVKETDSNIYFWLAPSDEDGDVTIYFKDYAPGLAITYPFINPFSNEMLSATIDVDMTNVNNNGYSAKNLKAMAMHELGHVLGLDETEDDNTYSIMRQSMPLIEDMTKPSSYDIQNIKSIY